MVQTQKLGGASTLLNSTAGSHKLAHSVSRVCFVRQRYVSTVTLAADAYSPTDSEQKDEKSALVLLHGLYGSKQNWRSLGKSLASKTGRQTFCLDLRNHGESPHALPGDSMTLAVDVANFLETRHLKDIVLMGHSMGGKVAMALALNPDFGERYVDRLISVDMTPKIGPISDEFARYIDGFRAIREKKVKSKREADTVLQDFEKSLSVRQFLLTNLKANETPTSEDEPLIWQHGVENLAASMEHIGGFPYQPGERVWHRPALFIKGELSKYINHKSEAVAREFFPEMQLEVVKGVNHWVHAEKPREFTDLVVKFCQ